MTDFEFKNHDISPGHKFDDQVRYELKPCKQPDGTPTACLDDDGTAIPDQEDRVAPAEG